MHNPRTHYANHISIECHSTRECHRTRLKTIFYYPLCRVLQYVWCALCTVQCAPCLNLYVPLFALLRSLSLEYNKHILNTDSNSIVLMDRIWTKEKKRWKIIWHRKEWDCTWRNQLKMASKQMKSTVIYTVLELHLCVSVCVCTKLYLSLRFQQCNDSIALLWIDLQWKKRTVN